MGWEGQNTACPWGFLSFRGSREVCSFCLSHSSVSILPSLSPPAFSCSYLKIFGLQGLQQLTGFAPLGKQGPPLPSVSLLGKDWLGLGGPWILKLPGWPGGGRDLTWSVSAH